MNSTLRSIMKSNGLFTENDEHHILCDFVLFSRGDFGGNSKFGVILC